MAPQSSRPPSCPHTPTSTRVLPMQPLRGVSRQLLLLAPRLYEGTSSAPPLCSSPRRVPLCRALFSRRGPVGDCKSSVLTSCGPDSPRLMAYTSQRRRPDGLRTGRRGVPAACCFQPPTRERLSRPEVVPPLDCQPLVRMRRQLTGARPRLTAPCRTSGTNDERDIFLFYFVCYFCLRLRPCPDAMHGHLEGKRNYAACMFRQRENSSNGRMLSPSQTRHLASAVRVLAGGLQRTSRSCDYTTACWYDRC